MDLDRAAPRRFATAACLSLLMPGLGHVYCGRVRAGLTIWGVVLAAWAFCLLVWTRWLFAPVLPAGVLLLAWGALAAVLLGDLWHLVGAEGPDYTLRPINHGVAYLSIFLGLGVLPVGASLVVVMQTRVGSVEVKSAAMFPHLLPGDRVLFDRTAYDGQPPRAGDLVVVEGTSGEPMVGRVVAVAGQTVHLRSGRLVVDGQALRQGPLDGLRVPRFGGEEAARLAALDGFLEDNHGRRYVVLYDKSRATRRREPAPEVLGPGEIYVVGDNRDAALNDRWHGRVRLDAVRGQPRCIWASHDARGAVRDGRAGLEVR